MKIFWIPNENRDHEVEVIDPNDRRTWKVIKGRKSVRELLNEQIDNPRNNYSSARKAQARAWHRL